jgi:hypothetical protein
MREGDAGELDGLDAELAGWSRTWQAGGTGQPIDAAAVRRQVRRRTRRFRLAAVAEAAVCLGMFGFLAWFARHAADTWDLVAAALLAALCVAALLRSLQVAKRHWAPAGESTADYLTLMVRRCRAMRIQVRVGWAVLAVEVAVFVPWIARTLHRRHGSPVPIDAALAAWGLLAAATGAAVVLLVALRWRNERERARWERLQRDAREGES